MISKEQLIELSTKYSIKCISDLLNVNKVSVYRWFKKYNIELETELSKKYNTRKQLFTEKLNQIIIGSLLGDGHIEINSSTTSARFEENHSIKQKDYFFWKVKQFGELIKKTKINKVKIGNKIHDTCSFKTLSSPEFLNFHNLFYKGSRKITNDIILNNLSNLSLAVWIMDDGSLNKNNKKISLHTDCFSYEEHTKLKIMFRKRFDLNATISIDNRTNNYHLIFNKTNSLKLSNIVRPYIIETMEYKLL